MGPHDQCGGRRFLPTWMRRVHPRSIHGGWEETYHPVPLQIETRVGGSMISSIGMWRGREAGHHRWGAPRRRGTASSHQRMIRRRAAVPACSTSRGHHTVFGAGLTRGPPAPSRVVLAPPVLGVPHGQIAIRLGGPIADEPRTDGIFELDRVQLFGSTLPRQANAQRADRNHLPSEAQRQRTETDLAPGVVPGEFLESFGAVYMLVLIYS